MKKQITLDDIKSIDHDELARLVYTQMDSNNTLYAKVEKMLLRSNPMDVVISIKKDISSIKRGRKFISYYESFEFAKRVESIVDDIAMMVANPLQARLLYKELILTDSKLYQRADDSSGSIQMAYAAAMDGWKGCLSALSDDEIYDDINQMLVCEGFGIRDLFSEAIPANVLKKVYDEIYARLENETIKEFEHLDDIHAMHQCAHYLKDPKLYIAASKLLRSEWTQNDIIDFAREYQYVDDPQGAIEVLTSIKSVEEYRANQYYELLIWAYEELKKPLEVTLAYKNWYETSKSPEILKKYLERLDGDMQIKAKREALEDAQKLSFSSALHFFYTLDEVELAGVYIQEHQTNLETKYMYGGELKKIANWLKGEYPQEVILLYRDSCEASLETSQSKNYPSAIKALKECVKIEEKNNTLSWYIEENADYMRRLMEKHKRKQKFVSLFIDAFGEDRL